MAKNYLTSYFSCVAKLFPEFTENTYSGKRVVFIPTASIVEKITFYVETDKKALENLDVSPKKFLYSRRGN